MLTMLFAGVWSLSLSVAQEYGGTLRVAERVEPADLDPTVAIVGRNGTMTFAFFDGLLRLDQDLELAPGLAREWEQLGPTHYRFHLHDGIRTHAGHTVDAAFIAEWMNDIWHGSGPPAMQQRYIQPVESVVVDELTVDFISAQVDPELLRYLAITHFAVYDVRHRNDIGADAFARNPSGTGPFRFAEWRSGERIVAVAFEDYFHGRPYLDEVHFIIIPDLATQVIAHEIGDIDVSVDVPVHEVERIDANPNLKVYITAEHRTAAFMPNLQDSVLGDVRVRRGLQHAIDNDAMVDALGAAAVKVDGLFAPGVFGLVEGLTYEYDPELAESLLNEAGWQRNAAGWFERDGRVMDLEIRTARGRYPTDYDAAEMVQLLLAEFGVRVSIQLYESASWWDMFRSMHAVEEPDYQLAGPFYGIRTTIPIAPLERKFGSGGDLNAGHFSDARFDELMELAKSAPNDEAMRAALEESQHIIYDNALEWVFYATTNVFALNERVQGFEMNPSQNIKMNEVWLEGR